ncbi:MAG: TauD/TfdA dioxygenase family protein [Acidimicrobiales bacterium]
MEIHKLTGRLGAVVEDVDLETIDDATFEALQDALMAHQVIFLRDQHLSDDGHRRLARRFGKPTVYPVMKHFGGTEFLHQIEDTEESPPDADGWHMDITWVSDPPKVAILAALVIPTYGGDTMWTDLYGAWDRLSPTMKEMLAPLQVLHTPGETFWGALHRVGTFDVAELRRAFPGAVHPLVRDHPVTGRTVLNLSGYFMESIVGMHPDESSWLLAWLGARVEDPNLQIRWRWREGDVAIWDEYSTNHRALSDHYPQHRRMRRCTVDGVHEDVSAPLG